MAVSVSPLWTRYLWSATFGPGSVNVVPASRTPLGESPFNRASAVTLVPYVCAIPVSESPGRTRYLAAPALVAPTANPRSATTAAQRTNPPANTVGPLPPARADSFQSRGRRRGSGLAITHS